MPENCGKIKNPKMPHIEPDELLFNFSTLKIFLSLLALP